MATEIIVRRYRNQDLDDLLSVWAAASEVAHPFLSAEFIASERENIPNVYIPAAETWVAEERGQVVGFISLLGNEVGAIFVHPEIHRRGIGRKLMDKANQLRGALELEVFRDNLLGRAFYAEYGFEPVATTLHEPTGFEVIRLRLATDPAPAGSSDGTRPGTFQEDK